MAKLTSLFMISLLLCFTLSCAARRNPAHPKDSPMATQQRETHETGDAEVEVEESCEGIGEDECLMRRTLVAHTDYIYTQKTKP